VRPIAALTLWLFVIGTSLILGAGLYEALVVVPFWSAGAPGSLAEGNPLLQVQVRAGHAFWQYFTPALGLIALLALLTSFGAPAAPSGMAPRGHLSNAPGFDRDTGLFSSGRHWNGC